MRSLTLIQRCIESSCAMWFMVENINSWSVIVSIFYETEFSVASSRHRCHWICIKNELFFLFADCLFSLHVYYFKIETTIGYRDWYRSTKPSHLLSSMSYLDETRVGIWGWGYGGYVTAMVLGTQQQIYKCGVSVSPITDYLFYSK